MSPDAVIIMQLIVFVLLGGGTFLLVWSLAGFLAKKPSKMERDIRDVKELLERLLDRLDGWRVANGFVGRGHRRPQPAGARGRPRGRRLKGLGRRGTWRRGPPTPPAG